MLPEILRTNLQQVILQLKAIGIKDVVKFDFLDKPEVEQIEQCIKQLQMINALDLDENLTKHGRNMSSLPLEPQYSHLLLRSIHFGCYEMVLDVVSVMEVENLIYIPRNSKISIQVIMNKFKVIITILMIRFHLLIISLRLRSYSLTSQRRTRKVFVLSTSSTLNP